MNGFLDKYGSDTTTNFQLLRWAKQLDIPNFTVLMRNELKKLHKLKTLPIFIICNYHTTEQSGVHWTAMYKNKDNAFFFDSYGIQPFQEAIDFLENFTYSSFKIQPEGSKICGQISLYILLKLSKGCDFCTTVLELNDYFNSKNDG